MRYVSIDIETTGLNSEDHQMIEFAAIIEDSNNIKSYDDSKKYRRIILSPNRQYNFSSFAAMLNSKLIKLISDIENDKEVKFENNANLTTAAIFPNQLIGDFKQWLYVNDFNDNKNGVIEVVAAGKNFASFDRKFIEAIDNTESFGLHFHHRSLDPTVPFINWKEDVFPPSTKTCKERANLLGDISHEALMDAWDVILLLRAQYTGINIH